MLVCDSNAGQNNNDKQSRKTLKTKESVLRERENAAGRLKELPYERSITIAVEMKINDTDDGKLATDLLKIA